MQVQFNKTAIRCLGTALQEVQNAEVTQEIRLPDGMPDIGRVLTTLGQIIIRSKEWQGNTILLSGGVMAWTLYAPEDGTEPRSVENWIPFQLKWDLTQKDREGPMRVVPLLRFADSRSLSARKMMLRAGVSAMVQAMYPMDAEVYAPGEIPEDVQLLKNTYPVTIPVESGEKTFLVDEETVLPDTGAPADKILGVMVHPEIGEKRVLSDKVIFKGMLNLHIVCRDQNGQVHSWDQTIPFSQLSELDRTYGTDAQADIQMAATSMEADMGEPGKIRIKCGLVAQYLIIDRYLLELIQDAYSPNREVGMELGQLELPVVLDDRMEFVTAEQSIPGQSGQVADAVFLPDFPRKRQTANGYDLELNGLFQTLYYDEAQSLQGASSRWEGRMSLNGSDTSSPMITVRSPGNVQTMMSADALALSAQMQLRITSGIMEKIPMVIGLELGQLQEADPARPSVIVSCAAKESLWELAKRSGSTISAIRMANGIEGENSGDGMLLIPVL